MTQQKIDWRRVSARMWAAQSRADLNERPRLLLAWLIYGTVECGRTQIIVPDMGELFEHLSIGKNHHREVRVALMDAGICSFEQLAAGGWRVTLFTDPARWSCGWYHESDAKARWLERLNSLPGQAQGELLEPDPDLTGALAAVAAESASNKRPSPAETVPSSRIGNQLARVVPELGTAHNVKTFNRSNVETNITFNVDALQARVRTFVGDDDFYKFWAKAVYLWGNPRRCRALEGSLNVMIAGVKSGELVIRKSAGRALWDAAQRDWMGGATVK